VGRLSIPYSNRLGVIGIKFRCLSEHNCKAEQCPKYLSPLGQELYLYNVTAVEDEASTVHITEGELDAVVLTETLGEPVVGVPGTSAWRPHHPWHFRGFERVLVWPDGDKAGVDWARMLRKELPAAEIVTMPDGHDVTSLYVEAGVETIRRLAGEDEE
jgi:DNA primase